MSLTVSQPSLTTVFLPYRMNCTTDLHKLASGVLRLQSLEELARAAVQGELGCEGMVAPWVSGNGVKSWIKLKKYMGPVGREPTTRGL